jgi:hypothetical protein
MGIAPYGQSQTTHIKIEFSHHRRITYQTHCAVGFQPDIAPSDFFIFGLLKNELAFRPVAEIGEPLEIVKAVLGTLAIETIARIFPTGSKD